MDRCRLVAVGREWIWEAETLGGGAVSMLPLFGMIPKRTSGGKVCVVFSNVVQVVADVCEVRGEDQWSRILMVCSGTVWKQWRRLLCRMNDQNKAWGVFWIWRVFDRNLGETRIVWQLGLSLRQTEGLGGEASLASLEAT